MSYLSTASAVPGLPQFGMLPALATLDPAFNLRTLRVYSVLVLHAKPDGRLTITQDRIAEMLGFFFVSKKTGERTPHRPLVSSLLRQLEKLGYLVRYGQTGFNKVAAYRLTVPAFDPATATLTRPDGSRVSIGLPTDRQEPTAQYEERKERERAKHTTREVEEGVFECQGQIYIRQDVLNDIESFNDGLALEVPQAVYHHFGITRPTRRDDF